MKSRTISLRKLQLVQNYTARLASGAHRYTHITPVLRQLHWLPICQRIKRQFLSLTFNIVHGDTGPQYTWRKSCSGIGRGTDFARITRTGSQCLVPGRLLGTEQFAACAPVLWNTLPAPVKPFEYHMAFCRPLKTCLFCAIFLLPWILPLQTLIWDFYHCDFNETFICYLPSFYLLLL